MYFNKFILNQILKPFLVGSLVGLSVFAIAITITYIEYKLYKEPPPPPPPPAEEITF